MTQDYRRQRSPPSSPRRKKRCKRPLIVLTYRDNQLDAIHSSTPAIQVVRVDLSGPSDFHLGTDDSPVTCQGMLLTALPIAELSSDLLRAAQRAFRPA